MEGNEQVVLNVQMGLFDFANRLLYPENKWVLVRETMKGDFDDTPLIQPVADTPENSNRPIVHMASRNVYSMDIARLRVDFVMAGTGPQTLEQIWNDFHERSLVVAGMFVEQAPRRVGLVVRAFYIAENPHEVASRILSDKIVAKNPTSILVNQVEQTTLGGFEANSTTEVNSTTVATISGLKPQLRGVQVARDLNIAQGVAWKASKESISDFLSNAHDSLDFARLEALLWMKTK
jgi:hypothetical protein